MLQIGEFSALTGISIDMLRNYDRLGFLKPERTDARTGYRYYGEKQIVRANRILVLKSLGFGLLEISEILTQDRLDDRIRTFLEKKITEKQEDLQKTERQIAQMRQALTEIEARDGYALSVSVKRLPARRVVSLRAVIREFSEEGILWERLDRACKAHGIRPADVPYCMAITHSVDFKRKCIDTEVFRIVGQDMPELPEDRELKFTYMPATEAAVVAFQGEYNRIGEIKWHIYRWIGENGYRISGKAFSIYYNSPEREKDPKRFITEICYPIRK